MAAAGQLAPIRVRPVDQIGEIGERAHEGDREPVANGLAEAGLILHVVRQVRQRVALGLAALIGDGFVAAGEGNRLEAQERNLLGIVEREAHHRAHLLIVHAVDQRDHRDDVDAGAVQILDRAQLHVEQVADRAMRIGFVADAVELQIRVAQTGFGGLLGELRALGELDAVGRGLHALIADLAAIADGVQEVRRKRRLAAGELHRKLAARLDRHGVVEQRLDLFPAQLMHEPDLVGVHEARIAHHVAAVGQIDGQHRSAAVRDGGGAVVVQLFVVVGADVAARENVFQVLEERRIDRHDVFELAVDRAILHHQDLAVALDDVGLDLADLLVLQDLDRQFAVQNLLADLRDALGAQRIGLARPAELGLLLLPALQQRLVGPLGRERRVRADRVELVKDEPGGVGGHGDGFFDVLDRLGQERSPGLARVCFKTNTNRPHDAVTNSV